MEVLSTGVGAQRNFEVGAEVQPELSWCGNDLEVWAKAGSGAIGGIGPGAPSFPCPGPMPLSTQPCPVGFPQSLA